MAERFYPERRRKWSFFYPNVIAPCALVPESERRGVGRVRQRVQLETGLCVVRVRDETSEARVCRP
jgi:hypothetical protein